MSLLVDLMTRDALDAGYAEAAARRGTRAGGTPGRALRVAAIVVVGGLMALAISALRAEEPAATRAKTALRDRVEQRVAATDALSDQLAKLRARVDALRTRSLEATAAGDRAASSLHAVELATAALPVTGPGITVTLDNAPAPVTDPLGDTSGNTSALGTVLDSDVQSVVNALWASGADAVAISGVRISTLSAIRAAGSAILVDFRPLSPPYTVEAIGDPRTLAANFADTRAARTLRSLSEAYGLGFGVASAGTLTLPGASGLVLRHADPAGAAK